jgi:hypothetical protein
LYITCHFFGPDEPFCLLPLDNERKNDDTASGIGTALAIRGNAGIPMIRKPVVTSQIVHKATPVI